MLDDVGILLLFISFVSIIVSFSFSQDDVDEDDDDDCADDTIEAAAICANCCKIAIFGYVEPSWFVDGQNGVVGGGGNIGKHAAVALRNDDVNDE